MLADANARVGSIISDAVGGEGAELGKVFHAFIAELERQTPLNPLLLSLRSGTSCPITPSPPSLKAAQDMVGRCSAAAVKGCQRAAACRAVAVVMEAFHKAAQVHRRATAREVVGSAQRPE